ncbi:MAG: DUF2868 domain-containing protein [Planctomycetes bacterium]|nr:DUF2868 domain-containing protein [Planctomycetota bacterium]
MNASRTTTPRLTLCDLIDLEMQLQADRDRDSQELRRRDAQIGAKTDARRMAEEAGDRPMFLAWIDAIREQTKSPHGSPGRQVTLFLEVVALVLAILGWALGFGAVTGWLRMDPTEPVNAIFFWSIIVGIQMLLLSVWLVAIVPTAWLERLPGAEAVQMLLRLIARGLPIAVAWIAARMSPEHRVLLARLRGTLQSWSWVYGRVRFWVLISLTQIFAVAYNVGAILAFLAISYGNDPAFGWKSRMLSAEALHRIVQTIAAPWSWFWPAAAPTLEQIEATRYTSLAERYLETVQPAGEAADAWIYWWPFLLACLLFYGLLPRIATLTFARWRLRRSLAQVKLDHGDFYKLKDRLTRPLVETQANRPETEPEPFPAPPTSPIHSDSSLAVSRPLPPRPPPPPREMPQTGLPETPPPDSPLRHVVQWAGVNLTRDDIGRLTRQRLGVEPADVFTVGDLQGKGDAQTLAALENDGRGEVLMVVESWEPPIADYVDFLSDLREAVGRERMIVVLLYNRDPQGRPCPPRPRDIQVWRDQIAAIGDPWMCVEELVETGQESAGKGQESGVGGQEAPDLDT